MKGALVFTVLAVFWQQCLVRGHVLGRPSLTTDLDQLKSLLERFEDSLAEEARKEELDADYEETNQEPEHSQTSRGWSLDPEGDRDNQMPEAAQPSAVGQSRTGEPEEPTERPAAVPREAGLQLLRSQDGSNRKRQRPGMQQWKRIA